MEIDENEGKRRLVHSLPQVGLMGNCFGPSNKLDALTHLHRPQHIKELEATDQQITTVPPFAREEGGSATNRQARGVSGQFQA